jgi:hypothetical protein
VSSTGQKIFSFSKYNFFTFFYFVFAKYLGVFLAYFYIFWRVLYGLGLRGLLGFLCFEVFWGTGGLTRATPGLSTCL